MRHYNINIYVTDDMPDILLFTTPESIESTKVKIYLESIYIPYKELDARESDNMEVLLDMAGVLDVPVLNINGNIIRGFEPDKIKQAIDDLIEFI